MFEGKDDAGGEDSLRTNEAVARRHRRGAKPLNQQAYAVAAKNAEAQWALDAAATNDVGSAPQDTMLNNAPAKTEGRSRSSLPRTRQEWRVFRGGRRNAQHYRSHLFAAP